MKISPPSAKEKLREENHSFTLTPEDYDDIYTLSNIIDIGDEVEAITMRKVIQENKGGDVIDSQRIKMTLRVKVEKIDIDLQGGLEAKGSIRLNGKNCLENRWVKLGSYHTLEIIPSNQLCLRKSLNSFEEEILRQSLDSVGKCDIAAVMAFPENGIALICQLGHSGINSRLLGRVNVPISKGKFASNDKAIMKYKEEVIAEIIDKIPISKMKAIILSSTHQNMKIIDDIWKELLKRGHSSTTTTTSNEDRKKDDLTPQKDYGLVVENKHKFISLVIPTQCSSPNDLSILIETEPRMKKILEDTKSSLEKKALDEFFSVKGYDENRTTYGIEEIEKASREGAIKLLLISDRFVRSLVIGERKRYSKIISEVKENGGKIEIFYSGSLPSEELEKMGGIGAILMFPIY